MTIDDVMSLVINLEVEAQCYDEDDNASVETVSRARAAIRAAILALLDAEAEACAAEIEGEWWRRGPECAESIRARIAARKGGAKP